MASTKYAAYKRRLTLQESGFAAYNLESIPYNSEVINILSVSGEERGFEQKNMKAILQESVAKMPAFFPEKWAGCCKSGSKHKTNKWMEHKDQLRLSCEEK